MHFNHRRHVFGFSCVLCASVAIAGEPTLPGDGVGVPDVLMGMNEMGQRSNDGHASLCPSYGAAELPSVEVLSTPPIVCSLYTIIPPRWIPCEPVGWAKVVPCPSGAGTTDSAGATVRHRAMC